MRLFVIMCFVALSSRVAVASTFEYQQFTFDSQGNPSSLKSLIDNVMLGDVVVVGELHGFYPSHEVQKQVITSLQAKGYKVSVGIEHLNYLQQGELDDYTAGNTAENDFLYRVGWAQGTYKDCLEYTAEGGFFDYKEPMPFSCFRDQLLAPNLSGGKALAINLPRSISGKVFKGGLESLSPDEMALIPPNFEVGRSIYFERFKEWVNSGSHGQMPADMLERMFVAQSLWDDTMAWTSTNYMATQKDSVLIILVGDFHASYGGGLADRLMARGAQKVHTISQELTGKTDYKNIVDLSLPHPIYGERGDLVIVTEVLSPLR